MSESGQRGAPESSPGGAGIHGRTAHGGNHLRVLIEQLCAVRPAPAGRGRKNRTPPTAGRHKSGLENPARTPNPQLTARSNRTGPCGYKGRRPPSEHGTPCQPLRGTTADLEALPPIAPGSALPAARSEVAIRSMPSGCPCCVKLSLGRGGRRLLAATCFRTVSETGSRCLQFKRATREKASAYP
jgi:hypothetical protein